MLKSYKNPRTPRKRTRHERTVFEGVFQSLSANVGELMLHASEEKLQDTRTGEERTVGIYTDPIVLRMDTVAHVKFIGKNITRNGLVAVETKEDVPMRAPHRSVTFVQSNTPASVLETDHTPDTINIADSLDVVERKPNKAPERKNQIQSDKKENKAGTRREVR